MSWKEIAAIIGFSNAASARNAYHNGSKVFIFGKYIANFYEERIIAFFTEIQKKADIETIANIKAYFGIMTCENCSQVITENQLVINSDKCPHCGHEYDYNDPDPDFGPEVFKN